MAKATMRDVARLAGVSIATVSSVINGTARVSERRAALVLKAMEALDYHPDQVARSLKVGRTNVIGMVIPDITNAFFPEVVRGAEDAARSQGYSVILCNSNEDPEQERSHLNTLASRRVDGVLIACADAFSAYESLRPRQFPVVFVDRIPRGLSRDSVCTNNIDASRAATRHLIELGHERIAFISGKLTLSPHADRLEGFRKAMQEANLVVRNEYVRSGDLRVDSGYVSALELVQVPDPPTAIITSNNKMLLGCMRALAESKIPCPDRVSVIGFDDYVWTEHFTPRITVVAQPTYEIGRRALEMLLDGIRSAAEGRQTSHPAVLLNAELRIRESTAPPRTATV
ncbi:MAG: LacI family DNA-binding transcriptional regulator [Bryobacteraceae bacterium]